MARPQVHSVTLYAERGLLGRLDLSPFVVVYAVVIGALSATDWPWELWGLALSGVIVTQGLVYLSSSWSLDCKCLLQLRQVTNLETARWIRVDPKSRMGEPAIVRLKKRAKGADEGMMSISTSDSKSPTYSFKYQSLVYLIKPTQALESGVTGPWQWEGLKYPVEQTLQSYGTAKGVTSGEVKGARRLWGKNSFSIPLPTWKELMTEQIVAPMFVFQLFCMLLFLLDDYWYLSIFTLGMLLIIEATVVQQRLSNLKELREMGALEDTVYIFRDRKWAKYPVSDIVPGDLCAVARGDGKSVPADMLLIAGSCIVNEAMLTGEAVPQMKEAIDRGDVNTLNTLPGAKLHVLYRGTEVVQVSPPPREFEGVRCSAQSAAVGYVLRTGFATEQGNLLRAIMMNTGRVSANNLEMGLFICFLLAFAVLSAGYVFSERIHRARKVYKLIVECLLIITSVVPPELPVQLSLAVNNALLKLRQKAVTCTEPFRIPIAGKLDVCCFDKTGTLTEDRFEIEGVAGLREDPKILISAADLTESYPKAAQTLASCHALVHANGDIIGDPLESSTLDAIEWSYNRAEIAAPIKSQRRRESVKVLGRFHFASALRRMSTIVLVESNGCQTVMSTCKGAPEMLKARFRDNVPVNYDDIYQFHAKRGARLLAFGYREFALERVSDVASITREEAETNLIFGGFLVVTSPIKRDSKSAIRKLSGSAHHVLMITGDNAITACHVARELRLVDPTKGIAVLHLRESTKGNDSKENSGAVQGCEWINAETDEVISIEAFGKSAIREISDKFEICVTGSALEYSVERGVLETLLPFVKVYARTAPEAKAAIIAGFNRLGLQTLMCGDGTNDVGALKQAHVGIALAASCGPIQTQKKRKNTRNKMSMQDYELPKLGDASTAASFTARLPSINSVCNVIRQGRCTLVTNNQMLRILALNCLMNSYGMSVLYLMGVKFSDTQMTVNSIFVASSMFLVTRSKPLEKLASERPTVSVLSPFIMLSILGQFAVHVGLLAWMVASSVSIRPPEPFDPETENDESEETPFKITLLNTTVYLMLWGSQAATIFVNYNGHPFMQSFWDNKWLARSVVVFGAVACFAASGLSAEFGTFLELEPDVPTSFRKELMACMMADVIGAWLVDRAIRRAFPLQTNHAISTLQ